MPTNRQIGRLYSLGNACGLDHAAVKAELFTLYRVSSSKDLSPGQYEQYTARLQRVVDAQAKGRAVPPEVARPRPGQYTSAAHLANFAEAVATFGRAWPELTDDDRAVLVILFDKFRLYRTRDRSLSQKQLDELVDKLRKFPLRVFRLAAREYLEKHTTKPEKYFLGICKGILRDEERARAAAQGDFTFA